MTKRLSFPGSKEYFEFGVIVDRSVPRIPEPAKPSPSRDEILALAKLYGEVVAHAWRGDRP